MSRIERTFVGLVGFGVIVLGGQVVLGDAAQLDSIIMLLGVIIALLGWAMVGLAMFSRRA